MELPKKWILIAVCIVSIIGLSRSLWDTWNRRDIVEIRKEKFKELQEKNDELKKRLEFVHTTDFVETEARDHLGMAKDGETIIIVKSSEDKKGKEQEVLVYPLEPNWKLWWRIFFEY